MFGLGASKAGLCGDVLTWLRSEAQRKVCAAPQFVSWAWDASQGAPGQPWLRSGQGWLLHWVPTPAEHVGSEV